MKKMLIKIFAGLALFILVLALLALSYDMILFKPYIPRIQKIIDEANPLYKNPPQALLKIAELAEGNKRINTYVIQQLLKKMERDKQRAWKWHLDYAMWSFLFTRHFSDADRFALWCKFAPYENGKGLNESSNFYYGRDINQLTTEELISIVAIVKAPSFYKTNPEKLKKRVNDLLMMYHQ